MSRGLGVELTEIRQVLLGQIVACQVEHGVLQSAGMTITKNKSITVDPLGGLSRVFHLLCPEQVGHGGASHGSSWVTAVGTLGLIGRHGTDGVHCLELELGSLVVSHGSACCDKQNNERMELRIYSASDIFRL